MKRKLCALLILFNFITPACREAQDDLDLVKQFKPDDKYFKASLVSLHFVIETSSISRVNQTFSQLIEDQDLPTNAQGCPDGTYTGESPFDAYDYKHRVKIKIKNETIISVDYNEIKKDGLGKQEDEEYCREMSVTGTTPAIAYTNLESQLADKQDIWKVDAISGATYSLYRFRYVVMIALMKARIAGI
jgi:major membrane immunogen (membrane-anchored lipoprotein)